ncbi:MAG: MBL fold metallo-hydrolase [Candidatus Omnitrophota bacterium]|nr:MBL fold metallo-hydrolase [Candidatus Omnitrophota bacterium]
MNNLVLETFVLGSLATNSYLIFDKQDKKGFIIDLPPDPLELKEFIEKENLDILFCLLTHAHFDHIGGLDLFKNIKVYLHPQDVPFLTDVSLNYSSFLGDPFVVDRDCCLLNEGDTIAFGNHSIEVIHTPGHTPGGVSVKLGNWLFSGDTIFCRSIGRTDIPLASTQQILASIKEKLMKLPEDTIVYPGHGHSTTIGEERRNNPFL